MIRQLETAEDPFHGFKDFELQRLDRDIAWMRDGKNLNQTYIKQNKADFFDIFKNPIREFPFKFIRVIEDTEFNSILRSWIKRNEEVLRTFGLCGMSDGNPLEVFIRDMIGNSRTLVIQMEISVVDNLVIESIEFEFFIVDFDAYRILLRHFMIYFKTFCL